MVIKDAYGTCGQYGVPHVFSSKILPPPDDQRCECGAVTWAESVIQTYVRRLAEREIAQSPSAEKFIKNR